MTDLDAYPATEVQNPIVDRCLQIAKENKPKEFAAWFCGGIIANVIGNLPDEYWQKMTEVRVCGVLGCDCHLVEQDAMKFLNTLRELHKNHIPMPAHAE